MLHSGFQHGNEIVGNEFGVYLSIPRCQELVRANDENLDVNEMVWSCLVSLLHFLHQLTALLPILALARQHGASKSNAILDLGAHARRARVSTCVGGRDWRDRFVVQSVKVYKGRKHSHGSGWHQLFGLRKLVTKKTPSTSMTPSVKRHDTVRQLGHELANCRVESCGCTRHISSFS